MAKIVVLHSGGLDSTVCLLMARKTDANVLSLGFDYGQRHKIELDYAAAQCERFRVTRKVLKLGWDKPPREVPKDRSLEEIRTGVSPAFLPGRNMIFLALGAAEAVGLGARELWIGVNSIDFSGYPDCRPEFIDAFRLAAHRAIPGGPEVVAPLQTLSKPEIAKRAQAEGLTETDTWSCYRPDGPPGAPTPCRRCDACRLHMYAWQALQ
jgi:7-cyano-7-deazaguanine synthase